MSEPEVKPERYDGLTPRERWRLRERYVQAQGGLCWYCKQPLSGKSLHEGRHVNWWRFPPEFLKHPVHLHHDHKTGLTIGAVHAYCNAVSFDYDESPMEGKP